MEQSRMDFERTEQTFRDLKNGAKITLLYRLLKHLGPGSLRTIIRYCCQMLDRINAELPDSDPNKQKYLNYGKHKNQRA